MADFTRKRLPHDIPDWVNLSLEAYFITINGAPRNQNQFAIPEAWRILLESVQYRESRGEWTWELFLAMPDHIHRIVTFPAEHDITKTISSWKRWHASKNNISWQKGFFEHRLRIWECAQDKAHYILMNPTRAGFVDHISNWPYYLNREKYT